jgi:hypothetical protein
MRYRIMKKLFQLTTGILVIIALGNIGYTQTHQKHTVNTQLLNAKQTAVNFLKWYTANLDRFQKLQGNTIAGTLGDSTKPYRINFEATEVYLKELSKSGYVSEWYIDHFRPIFKTVNEDLIKHKQWDGPIIGYEWDLVFPIIETDEITDHLNELKPVYQFQNTNGAYLIFKLGKSLHFTFSMWYYQGKWLINELSIKYI